MPFYEVQHVAPLSNAQQDELAEAITDIHSTHFAAPRALVIVRFTDLSQAVSYIGGRRRGANFVMATVRVGPARTAQDWERLCGAVVSAWDRIVPMPVVKRGAPTPDFRLRGCVVLGAMTATWEVGFMLAPAGGDVRWMHEHWAEFEKRAAEGDEDMVAMVEEVKQRGLLNGTN